MPDEERDWIVRARGGDRVALGALYDRFYQPVFTFFFYRVPDRETAEELTARVFVRMVEKIGVYKDLDRPFLAWLYTIARNLLIDTYRKKGRMTVLPLDEKMAGGEPSAPLLAQRELTADCLRGALQQLTEEQREVIISRFIENRKLEEVAADMEKSLSAVKSLQHRALGALRRALDEEPCYER